MPMYEYYCSSCQEHSDSFTRADSIICLAGHKARRVWSRVNIDAASARHRGRWDPVVGEYVESDRQFNNLLSKGRDEQSAKLNMDVKLATVDARDNEGLAELHGYSPDQRLADLESGKKAKRDAASK